MAELWRPGARLLHPRRLVRRRSDRRRLEAEVAEARAALARYELGWPPGHFYSPIPCLDEVRAREGAIFAVDGPLAAIDLNESGQLELLRQLAAHYADVPFSDGPQPGLRYFYDNPNFRHGEAIVLCCLIRHARPRRIVEIGSGHSSCVILDTNERFFDGSISCAFVDPHPELLLSLLDERERERIELVPHAVQDVDDGLFASLAAGDVLFVDSTHVAKVGSDVNDVLFRILPLLARGVWVHFHDVHYPFEYPREWIYEGRAWNETYLLRAFLQYNGAFEIALFNSFVAQRRRAEIEETMPLAAANMGSSLWLRKVAPAGEAPPPAERRPAETGATAAYSVAYHPDLVPPPELMRTEQIEVLEEWFRWAEEWSMLLRIYGRIRPDSRVLEIGCGLGRIAFPLRLLLFDGGSYEGFDVVRAKVDFLRRTFEARYPNFRFRHADVANTAYNPGGAIRPTGFRFPYRDGEFDLVFAASVFTHLVPHTAQNYLSETARVLKPGGRAVLSFFLLDYYDPRRERPLGFAARYFAFDHPYGDQGRDVAVADPRNPEETIAYRLGAVDRLAAAAGLQLAQPPLRGLWSGGGETWVGAQDVLVLERRER